VLLHNLADGRREALNGGVGGKIGDSAGGCGKGHLIQS